MADWENILSGGRKGIATGMGEAWTNLRQALAYDEAMAQPLPTYTYEQSMAEANKRASPIIQALNTRENYLKPIVSEEAFAPVAERGFGDSGVAETQVARALSELRFNMEEKAQNALSQALRDVRDEQQQEFSNEVSRRQLLSTQEQNRLARQAQQD